ncbi:acyl-CoA carboxylase subunit epsilon [Streptomyces sp. NBC_01190]|uniref:acyl-CoA carboxylase subunit epsilon n=1 Tax=Streptomyces sp. NBC_01190 TaxID=2903767 RepID=UPI00386F9BF2|nr:acyl-CoA carboxylase subunit epsilon [Streptomyces sp. NBC_01190]
MIRVERGCPTPEELAAVVALVQLRAASAEAAGDPADDAPGPPAVWADPARTVPRAVPRPGPGAWRTSVWPA